MTSSRDQYLIVFLILYGCGALIELLIRVSQGLPRPTPPFFARRSALCSTVLQPAVFFVLPALLWPLVIVHRILGPVVAVVRECCCCGCGRKVDEGLDDDDTTISGGSSMHSSTGNRSGSTMDVLEKGGLPRAEAPPRCCDSRVLSP